MAFIASPVVLRFATHVRVLKSFLYDKRGRLDDVNAADFVADLFAWERVRGPLPAAPTRAAQRTGKKVAHLTRRRYAGTAVEKQWVPYELLAALAGPLKQFVVMVPEAPPALTFVSSCRPLVGNA